MGVQDVEGNLSTDRVGETVIGEGSPKLVDERRADLVDLQGVVRGGLGTSNQREKGAAHLIESLKLVTLLDARGGKEGVSSGSERAGHGRRTMRFVR